WNSNSMSSVICDKPYTSADKWTASIMIGLLFLIISSPFVYKLTNKITNGIGIAIVDEQGCPNLIGLLSHAIIFVLILRLIINRDQTKGCIRPYSSQDKWMVAAIGGLLFVLVSSPFLYDTVNSLTTSFSVDITIGVAGC